MKYWLLLFTFGGLISCSQRDLELAPDSQVWLDGRAFQLDDQAQAGAYVFAMLNIPEANVEQAGIRTVSDENGHDYRAVVGTYLIKNSRQSVIIPVIDQGDSHWVGECVMACTCSGDCSACVLKVFEKCKHLSSSCSSGQGPVGVRVSARD